MIPEAQVVHRTPRRLRLRIPSRRGNSEFFAAVQEELRQIEGVEMVRANPLTGSVLVVGTYAYELLHRHAQSRGLFALAKSKTRPLTIQQRFMRRTGLVNRVLKRFTGGEIDIGSLAFLYLFLSATYQLAKGNFAVPAWYTALWYAANVLLKSADEDAAMMGDGNGFSDNAE